MHKIHIAFGGKGGSGRRSIDKRIAETMAFIKRKIQSRTQSPRTWRDYSPLNKRRYMWYRRHELQQMELLLPRWLFRHALADMFASMSHVIESRRLKDMSCGLKWDDKGLRDMQEYAEREALKELGMTSLYNFSAKYADIGRVFGAHLRVLTENTDGDLSQILIRSWEEPLSYRTWFQDNSERL